MAEKYLKIIQNGNTTFVPDNQRNRSFWAKQNSLVARSRSAHTETVTILPATEEEVAFMQYSDVGSSAKQPASVLNDNSAIFEMMNRLQRQNEEQALKLAELEAKHSGGKSLKPDLDGAEDSAKAEKAKPGPKPKDK